MKLTPQERDTIKRRAVRAGKTVSRYILDLVQNDSEKLGPLKRTPTAIELLHLPASERRKLLREQAKIAAPYYQTDPDLNFEIHDDILDS